MDGTEENQKQLWTLRYSPEDMVNRLVVVQSLVRRYLALKSFSKLKKMTENRRYVVTEMLDTERKYVASLEVLYGLYYEPLRNSPELLGPQDLVSVFSTLEVIIKVNEELLKELEDRRAEWSSGINRPQCVGDIFLQMAPFLKTYTQYCNNYDNSLQVLEVRRRENPNFDKFLRQAQQSEDSRGLDLSSFLIMPVQRIPRYKLLLEQVVKYTDPEHPDFQNVCKALDLVGAVASNVNERVREFENRRKVVQIQIEFGNNPILVTPTRLFVREGQLVKISSRAAQSRQFFLFNDLLVYAKRRLGKLVYVGSIPLCQQGKPNVWIRSLADTKAVRNAFQIVCPKKTYTLYAASADDKESWMRELTATIEALIKLIPNQSRFPKAQIKVKKRKAAFFNLFTVAPEKFDSEYSEEYAFYGSNEHDKRFSTAISDLPLSELQDQLSNDDETSEDVRHPDFGQLQYHEPMINQAAHMAGKFASRMSTLVSARKLTTLFKSTKHDEIDEDDEDDEEAATEAAAAASTAASKPPAVRRVPPPLPGSGKSRSDSLRASLARHRATLSTADSQPPELEDSPQSRRDSNISVDSVTTTSTLTTDDSYSEGDDDDDEIAEIADEVVDDAALERRVRPSRNGSKPIRQSYASGSIGASSGNTLLDMLRARYLANLDTSGASNRTSMQLHTERRPPPPRVPPPTHRARCSPPPNPAFSQPAAPSPSQNPPPSKPQKSVPSLPQKSVPSLPQNAVVSAPPPGASTLAGAADVSFGAGDCDPGSETTEGSSHRALPPLPNSLLQETDGAVHALKRPAVHVESGIDEYEEAQEGPGIADVNERPAMAVAEQFGDDHAYLASHEDSDECSSTEDYDSSATGSPEKAIGSIENFGNYLSLSSSVPDAAGDEEDKEEEDVYMAVGTGRPHSQSVVHVLPAARLPVPDPHTEEAVPPQPAAVNLSSSLSPSTETRTKPAGSLSHLEAPRRLPPAPPRRLPPSVPPTPPKPASLASSAVQSARSSFAVGVEVGEATVGRLVEGGESAESAEEEERMNDSAGVGGDGSEGVERAGESDHAVAGASSGVRRSPLPSGDLHGKGILPALPRPPSQTLDETTPSPQYRASLPPVPLRPHSAVVSAVASGASTTAPTRHSTVGVLAPVGVVSPGQPGASEVVSHSYNPTSGRVVSPAQTAQSGVVSPTHSSSSGVVSPAHSSPAGVPSPHSRPHVPSRPAREPPMPPWKAELLRKKQMTAGASAGNRPAAPQVMDSTGDADFKNRLKMFERMSK